jgi:hypothetical protein
VSHAGLCTLSAEKVDVSVVVLLAALQNKALSIIGKKGSTLEAGQTLDEELKRLFSSL